MLTAFVDGSYAKQGGWAAIVRGDKNYEIGGRFECKDNYEAELCAVYKALESSEGKISIVCDHAAIVDGLMCIKECGAGWYPPEKCHSLWLKVMYEAHHKLESVKWVRGDSLPEMKMAHKMANTHAQIERGR
jgi:ribonuclease HI